MPTAERRPPTRRDPPLVLVVDNDRPVAEQYAFDLRRLGGFRTRRAFGGSQAIAILQRELVDCVILDLKMPGLNGFAVLGELQDRRIDVPVIVYTGFGNFDDCIRAVKLGAFSFIDKEKPMEHVVHRIHLALKQTDLRVQVDDLKERASEKWEMIGESDAMSDLHSSIDRLTNIPSPVLILGESGTGKELVARRLHNLSGRSKKPFVPINCGGVTEEMANSDLFGHKVGAFTGAATVRRGAFEQARSGTLFLDEIGEMSAGVQVRLLRIIDTGEMQRMGGERLIPVETRIIAATNRNLEAAVEDGKFREDLLYRLNVHVIRMPALRERPGDVRLLAEHFAAQARRLGKRPRPISAAAMSALERRRWERNNVRELKNTIERMIIASDDSELDLRHLPGDLGSAKGGRGTAGGAGASCRRVTAEGFWVEVPVDATKKKQEAAAETAIIRRALEANSWHTGRTAKSLGHNDHSALSRAMKRLGIVK